LEAAIKLMSFERGAEWKVICDGQDNRKVIQLLEKDCQAWEEAAKSAEYIPMIASSDGLHWRSGKEEAAKFRARIAEHAQTIKQLQKI
jgi:hypothetical protein